MKRIILLLMILVSTYPLTAQNELLTNASVIEMTKAGISTDLIASKIRKSDIQFDITVSALIELKNAGVADEILALMMDRAESALPAVPFQAEAPQQYSENAPPVEALPTESVPLSPRDAVLSAKSIALIKSSLQPSRQNLEKALLNRSDFKRLNLTILRYKEEADLYVEIGYVSGSWITHRYVYRIFDRRSGSILAAGETTSWGSLSEHLAKKISRDLNQLIYSAAK